MRFYFKYKCGVLLLSGMLLLAACSDETEKSVQSTATNSASNAIEFVAYSGISSCDEYFSTMQSCITPQISAEERQKMALALNVLGEKIKNLDDHKRIEEQCQGALKEIGLHKKEIGCSV